MEMKCLIEFVACSFVHGRLPYENLKPDPVLRSLLLSLPIRKFVSFFLCTNDICMYSSVCLF